MRAAADERPAAAGRWAWAALGLLGCVYLGLALGSARHKSVTVDELGHLPAGYYYLTTGDARYTALNPPLLSALAALPVVASGVEGRLPAPPPSDDPFSFWSQGYRFMESFRADYLRVYGLARGASILLFGLVGVVLFLWARALCPRRPELAGLLAAALVWLSPGILAHARLVTTDAGAAAAVLLAHWCLWRFLGRPSAGRAALLGLALGLAQLTKVYALLFYPVCVLLAVLWWWRPAVGGSSGKSPVARRALYLAGAFVLSLVVLDSGYLWQGVGTRLGEIELRTARLQELQRPLAALPLPVPAAYVRAFDGQLHELTVGQRNFLFGRTFDGGSWVVYPALLLVKTPLPLAALLLVAVVVALRHRPLDWRTGCLLLLYPLALFAWQTLGELQPLGTRALLSAALPVWLWAAVTLAGAPLGRWARVLVMVLLAAAALETARAYPHYLAYFNPLAGGRDGGYRYATDANLDWGQDLVGLRRELEARGAGRVQLAYFGSVDPEIYGIDYELPREPLRPGLLAVSVTLYHRSYPVYDHGRLTVIGPIDPARLGLGERLASIGGSIHLYRVPLEKRGEQGAPRPDLYRR